MKRLLIIPLLLLLFIPIFGLLAQEMVAHPDTDLDGIRDTEEIDLYRTDPESPDTDGDSFYDGLEVFRYHSNPLDAADPAYNALFTDLDQDGLLDVQESDLLKTHPDDWDSDDDGIGDGIETYIYGTDPLKADARNSKVFSGDADRDGLLDSDEEILKTDSDDPDTDDDGFADGVEVWLYGSNPLENDEVEVGGLPFTIPTSPELPGFTPMQPVILRNSHPDNPGGATPEGISDPQCLPGDVSCVTIIPPTECPSGTGCGPQPEPCQTEAPGAPGCGIPQPTQPVCIPGVDCATPEPTVVMPCQTEAPGAPGCNGS